MTITQADVAAVAGVSRRTVSNVVNQFPYVSADVQARVNDAIKKLGYTPNMSARSLRTGSTRTIQLAIPELDVPYFAELARWIVAAAEEQGLSVIVRQTLGDKERENRAIESGLGEFADGTILSPVASKLDAILERKSKVPIVLVGEMSGDGKVPHVGIDNELAAYAATRHLIDIGRRRIAFVGAQEHGPTKMAEMRQHGYERALAESGLPVDATLVATTDAYHRSDGAAAMNRLLELPERPDAVFGATDLLALGAMRAAHDAGIRVPDQLAVIGFDDIDEGRFSIPRLSTISPDKRAIAEGAVKRIVGALEQGDEGGVEGNVDQLVGFTLVRRESS
jgi:DNA-binding LacI/PurR family transcriptional regulator